MGSIEKPQPRPPWQRLATYLLTLSTFLCVCTVMRERFLWFLGAASVAPLQQVVGFERPSLQFTKDGKFQIGVFEDLHLGEPSRVGGPAADRKTLEVVRKVLSLEEPQLVVLNGDLITGEDTFLENSTDYLDMLVKPLVEHNLPWASTYGNHDAQYNLSTKAILAREKQYPLALTNSMVSHKDAGTSNYYLEVSSSSSKSSEIPAMLLWFFDSRGGTVYQKLNEDGKPTIGIPGFVHESVATWFTKKNQDLVKKYGKVIPSLAFVHIPTYASNRMQAAGLDPNAEPGINADNPLSPQGIECERRKVVDGEGDTECHWSGADLPFMESLVNTKGLMAVFSGHDHRDDWCAKWNSKLDGIDLVGSGVNLCFGRHSGYGGYSNAVRGSRQIVVNEDTLQDFEVETWNRLEDASISGLVTLNSTYGTDKYPFVPYKDSSDVRPP